MIEELLETLLDETLSGIQRKAKFEQTYYSIALTICNGNMAQAARYCGVSHKTVHSKVDADPMLNKVVRDHKERFRQGQRHKKTRRVIKDMKKGVNFKKKAIQDACQMHIENTRRTFSFRRSSLQEQVNIINRIKALYQ